MFPSYLPLLWNSYLAEYQLFDLSGLGAFTGGVIGVLVHEFLVYVWHLTMHGNSFLWRVFHQMHHSAERLDAFGAFYFSPIDMIGWTFIGSFSLSVIVGLSPQAVTIFLFATLFLGILQHTNITTPRWLGYIVQRPESHTLHHGRGLHTYNYSDLPIFDILFGTFRSPKNYKVDTGFYRGASARILKMLLFRDVSEPKAAPVESASATIG